MKNRCNSWRGMKIGRMLNGREMNGEQNIGKSLTVYVYADFLDTNDVTAADRFTMSIAAAADLSIKDSDDTDVSE